MLVIKAETQKWLSEKQTGNTLIRLLLQKQSDMICRACTVCLGLFSMQLVFEILGHLEYRMTKNHWRTVYNHFLNILPAFCNTSDLHDVTICHKNLCFVFFEWLLKTILLY